jgi:hypothetical protein
VDIFYLTPREVENEQKYDPDTLLFKDCLSITAWRRLRSCYDVVFLRLSNAYFTRPWFVVFFHSPQDSHDDVG